MESKEVLLYKCNSVLKMYNNCIDNLPLDDDIIAILAKTHFFKYKGVDFYDYHTCLDNMEEPNIFSYESTFNEYGYKLAGRKMLPSFVDCCIKQAVNIQTLRYMESKVYNQNKELDQERIALLDQIDELRKKRNRLYEEIGSFYELSSDKVEIAIAASDLALNLARIPLGYTAGAGLSSLAVGSLGAAGLGATAAGSLGFSTSAMLGGSATATLGAAGGAASTGIGLPIAGLLTIIGLVAYGKNRKKKHILKGMEEASQFFSKTLIVLHENLKGPKIKALEAIKMIRGDILEILADIDEAHYIISKLKIEINMLSAVLKIDDKDEVEDSHKISQNYVFQSSGNESVNDYSNLSQQPHATNTDVCCSGESSRARQDFVKLVAEGLNYNNLWSGVTHGDPEAAYKMGLAYDFGGFECGSDIMEACKWYKKAASHGHEGAKMRLNDIFTQSNAYDDFRKLQAEGINYSSLWRDVTHGDSEAAYKIGLAYDFGGLTHGIDKREACKWYESAASHGHKGAKMRLNELLVIEF